MPSHIIGSLLKSKSDTDDGTDDACYVFTDDKKDDKRDDKREEQDVNVNSSSSKSLAKENMYVSLDFDCYVTKLKRLVNSDSRLKSLFGILLISKVKKVKNEAADMDNHVHNFRHQSLIKIKDAVLQ